MITPVELPRMTTPRATQRTSGANPMPGTFGDVRRLLYDLEPEDLAVLDAELAAWAARPLGRELLAGLLMPAAGTVLVELLNIEPAGFILLERGSMSARIRALAVAPDLRRRGIARTLLIDAEAVVRERGIDWLWVRVPASDVAATRCALACGFQRYRPQFLRRARPGALPLTNSAVRVEALAGAEARESFDRWYDYEAAVGDSWCADLARTDLRPPPADECLLCIVGDHAVGLATVAAEDASTAHVTLQLDADLWGQPLEALVLKAVIDSLHAAPDVIELHLGSGEHLRASASLYRGLGFAPTVYDDVVFVRRAGPPPTSLRDEPDGALGGDPALSRRSNMEALVRRFVERLRRIGNAARNGDARRNERGAEPGEAPGEERTDA
jgi:GNAT superfamily N-acetyltransferase